MNHFTLTECLRKIFNVRTHLIGFTLPVTETGGHRNKPSHSTTELWGAPGTRAESGGTSPTTHLAFLPHTSTALGQR